MEKGELASNTFDIRNNLRTKFDTEKENVEVRKDDDKYQDHKNKICTIRRSCKRHGHREADNDIEVISRNLLSINFSLEDSRPHNWNPWDPLLITTYIRENQIHNIYIDNGSNTDILYEHCFR